jgi:hypothetical protein
MWAIIGAATLVIAAVPSPVATGAALPVISRCELETTQRVAFRLDGAPKEAIASVVRISLFGKNRAWLADEVVFDTKGDAPILGIAGLLDAQNVTAVRCAYGGYVDSMDQFGMVSVGDSATGRRACAQRDGLDVDGGPDAQIDTIVFGRNWILARLYLDVNHFFPNQETNFNGDVFAASIDGRTEQKVVVDGAAPQFVSFLFTDLSAGLHQINYGPWSVFDAVRHGAPGYSDGYHNLCVKI